MASSGAMMVVWFVVILALIPVSLWVLKRSGLAQRAGLPGAPSLMKVVAQLSLGPGQRLVAVEVGQGEARTWLVLGVTAQSIQTLHALPPQAPEQVEAPAIHPAFATLLRRAGRGDQETR